MSEVIAEFEKLVNFALEHGYTLRAHSAFGEIYRDVRRLLEEQEAYITKLVDGLPMLPKDIELLRDANFKMATELNALTAAVRNMMACPYCNHTAQQIWRDGHAVGRRLDHADGCAIGAALAGQGEVVVAPALPTDIGGVEGR